ncbi:lanosterol 14-alpha-demethylase [Dacryopinax primogenitus]|uniref:Lanosterol 14-alpha-demethylase n=1 Tax=Dacryopinax primogenitus (strain DJM 731) TaxID=1858805 RepID=M5G888_DACPD|nr:lanosterol 14-alpha-demethylase [Dacryopinax primogenitus]EJU04979.1 lanosterol 14-alpha-demethylase [Dacryopinax primogenitus]
MSTLISTVWEHAQPYVEQAKPYMEQAKPYVEQGRVFLEPYLANPNWPIIAVTLALVFPIIAIVLNVASQLLLPRDRTKPPTVFHLIPFIGSAVAYGMDPYKFFFSMREKYGEVFTFILLGRKMTVCLGAKGTNTILGGKLSQVCAEDAYTHLTTPVFGQGVVYDVPNHILMEQKRFVKFGLNTDNFRAYVGMIEDELDHFLNSEPEFAAYRKGGKEDWGHFDAFEQMSELTILTASRTLQGKEVRSQMDKTFAQLYMDLDGGFTPLNFMFPNLPLPSYRRRDKAQKAMSDFYVNILQQRRASKSDEVEYDMLASLMDQSYKDGRVLSDREIAHIMIALLMAGQHTSSATMAWCLLNLAVRPDVQQAMYDEQVKHFGAPNGTLRSPTFEELKDLPVLDSVIRETLRVHPPLHSLMRKVISDMPLPATLGNASEDQPYIVPKGNFLLAAPCITQIDPAIWTNSFEWDPSRWVDPNSDAARMYAEYTETGEKVDYGFGLVSKGTESPYQPFGSGRHRCIGEQFAYVQLGTLLALIVRKLEMKADKVPPHNYTTMITTPSKPRDITFRRRQV